MKLYWRIKKNGKWSWKPAVVLDDKLLKDYIVMEEEE